LENIFLQICLEKKFEENFSQNYLKKKINVFFLQMNV